jgi:transcriptional regulator with XRE-family HTH domain
MNIGQRIKRLRIKNGLTLEELASRCELTKGFISQLERDLTSPSIATLNDITEALGISMAEFFIEEEDEKIVFAQDDFFIDEKDDIVIQWIVPNAQKNEMEPIEIHLKPLAKSFTISPHEGEEFGYVLAGRVILVDGERRFSIKKGQTFYIKGTNEHYLENPSQSLAKVLWVCTPPIF